MRAPPRLMLLGACGNISVTANVAPALMSRLWAAALLLPAGAIADRYGRKPVFLCWIAGFAAASLLCGLAPMPAFLLIARAVQGAVAAFLLALALAIIGHAFHEEGEGEAAWAFWGGIMGLTLVLSPLRGGIIAELAGWRLAFLVNLPVCAALGVAADGGIANSRNDAARGLDPLGIALFAAAMLCTTSGLIYGHGHGWTAAGTVNRFAAGAGALLLFILVEMRQRQPKLDLTLFRQRRFVGAGSRCSLMPARRRS